MSGMSRKHYKLLAQAFANCRPWDKDTTDSYDSIDAWTSAVGEVCKKLKQDNPNFDRQRFLDACNDLPAE